MNYNFRNYNLRALFLKCLFYLAVLGLSCIMRDCPLWCMDSLLMACGLSSCSHVDFLVATHRLWSVQAQY